MVPSWGTSGQYGGYDALGRVPLTLADDGRVVSAQRYNAFSGALEGECKRFGDAVACGSVSGSGFGSGPGLRHRHLPDRPGAGHLPRGEARELRGFGDGDELHQHLPPQRRLATSQAAPGGTVTSLTQDWLETFNGIGNLSRVETQRNTASGNGRPDRYETKWYTPETPGAGKALDRVVAIGSRLSETSGGTVITGTAAATPGSTGYAYDLVGHLTQVTRTSGGSETLSLAKGSPRAGRSAR